MLLLTELCLFVRLSVTLVFHTYMVRDIEMHFATHNRAMLLVS